MAQQNDKKFVCLMNDSFPPLIDGVATTVSQYAKYLTENHDGAVVATPQYPGAKDEYNYPVVRYPSLSTEKLISYRAGMPFHAPSLRALEQYPIALLHSHCPFVSTYLARTLRDTFDAPIIFTYHTKFDVDIAKLVRSGMIQNAAKRVVIDNISACDEVWVVSKGAGDNLRELGYEGDVHFMENGVDFPKGRADSETIDRVREMLQKNYGLDTQDGVPLFLFVGRMMWYKGNRLTIDALSALEKQHVPFHMVFVGDGTDLPDIKEYAQKCGIGERCVFTGAIRDREILRAFYSICSMFLFPSTYDTNGIVVREAAACGLPSLLISGSCAAEGVEDRVTGFLAEENAQSIAKVLFSVCENPDICKKVGDGAQTGLYLSWEDSVARAYDRYGTVLDRYHSGQKRKYQSVTDDLLLTVSEILGSINRMHKANDELRALAESTVRRSDEQIEKTKAELKKQGTAMVDKAEKFYVDTDKLIQYYTKEAKNRASKLHTDTAEWLETQNAELKNKAHELQDHFWDLFDRYL